MGDAGRALRERVGAVVVPSRVLRRVIKRHRRLPGLGLDVPHRGSYVLSRDALAAICDEAELGCGARELPESVILVARELFDEADGAVAVWRALFHGAVHRELDARRAGGALTDAAIRARVHRIGQTEFDEIRFVLRHDDHLLPPFDDAGTYVEFAATYLEIRAFAPQMVDRTFPALADLAAIDGVLAADVGLASLLASTRPDGAPSIDELAASHALAARERRGDAIGVPRRWRPRASGAGPARASRVSVASAPDDGRNQLPALLAAARAWGASDEASADEHATAVADGVERLGRRLAAALKWRGAEVDEMTPAFVALVQEAASGHNPWNVEARMLHDVQRACIDHERETYTVDLVGWVRTLGRRPVRRALPAQRGVRIVKHLRAALAKAPRTSVPEPERSALAHALRDCVARAESNLRDELRPRIEAALAKVHLVPNDVPERVASKKLVDELIDQAVVRGALSLGNLRDAVSRNDMKLANVAGPLEVVRGDALLGADDALAASLDGVYRRGEIYLRLLQRFSAVLFGTRVGRFLTLYALVPFGAAYVGLEGLQHVVGPLCLFVLHVEEPHIFTHASFVVTAATIFALLHSALARRLALATARGVGLALHAAFVACPRWVLSRPLVRAILDSRPVLVARRYVLRPLVLAAALGAVVTRFGRMPVAAHPVAFGAAFVLANVALNSRVGARLEEAATDYFATQWRDLRRHVLPGIYGLLASFFRAFVDGVESGIYAVDALLLFRRGDAALSIAIKAVAGVVWFFASYLVRVYVNLLIEPQVNPIKHFPVVTVAAKIILPFSHELIRGAIHGLARVMPRGAAAAIGVPSVLMLPGFFGFLVWELKENFKLYRMNRGQWLSPVAIGHHGETMAALLKPGFHSGTIPKAYAKLRRATWRGSARALAHREALHHVEEAIRRFVERELVTLLEESPRWTPHVEVGHIEIASNRVRIALVCEALQGGRDDRGAAKIAFEEQSGWLVASVAQLGWIAKLDDAQRVVLENGLAGLYALAAVDMVRERIEAELAAGGVVPAYDVADDGIVVWPDATYKTELVYPLDRRKTVAPSVRGERPLDAPRSLDVARVFFRTERIPRAAWAAAWGEAADGAASRILSGPSLLAARGGGS